MDDAGEPLVAPRPRRRAPRLRARLLRPPLLLGIPAAVALGGLYAYATGGRHVGTDNAYVKAHKVAIAAEVTGRIASLDVGDNEAVRAGQMLFTLDQEPFAIALDKAKAAAEAARLSIAALKASHGEKTAELRMQQAMLAYAEREFRRQTELAAQRVATEARLDQARSQFDVARNQVAAIQQDMQRILAQLGGRVDIAPDDHPQVRDALAAVRHAELDLRRTIVVAPAAGIVSQVALVRPGAMIEAGQPALSLVETAKVWIEANLKETDLTHVKVGNGATVTVDAYPGRTFTARVESIGAATGAEFSVLPPQNASGNWVKVVQRLPVRLALDLPDGAPALRAGMSADVSIDTGHQRALPGFIHSALAAVGRR